MITSNMKILTTTHHGVSRISSENSASFDTELRCLWLFHAVPKPDRSSKKAPGSRGMKGWWDLKSQCNQIRDLCVCVLPHWFKSMAGRWCVLQAGVRDPRSEVWLAFSLLLDVQELSIGIIHVNACQFTIHGINGQLHIIQDSLELSLMFCWMWSSLRWPSWASSATAHAPQRQAHPTLAWESRGPEWCSRHH